MPREGAITLEIIYRRASRRFGMQLKHYEEHRVFLALTTRAEAKINYYLEEIIVRSTTLILRRSARSARLEGRSAE